MKFINENKFMIGVMIFLVSISYAATARNIDYERNTANQNNVVMQTK